MYKKIFYYINKNILLVFILLLIILKIPSLFEPYWYGDEGIYAAVAHAMNSGSLLYKDIWDNKTPGIYYIYSFIFHTVGVNQFFIRLSTLILAVISLIFFYKIIKILFPKINYIIQLLVFVFLFSTPFIESNIANGENYFVPLSIIGLYFFIKYFFSQKKIKYLFLFSFFYSIAFFIKIHPIFEFLSIFIFLFVNYLKDKNLFNKNKINNITYLKQIFFNNNFFKIFILIPLVFFIPTLLYLLSTLILGNLNEFIKMFLTQGSTYVFDFQYKSLGFVFFENNLYSRSLVILITTISLIYLYIKNYLSKKTFFIFIIFAFSFFAVTLSQRPYPHYLLQLVVPGILLLSLVLERFFKENLLGKIKYLIIIFLSVYFIFGFFYNGEQIEKYKVYPYYENFFKYITGQISLENYNNYFDSNVNQLNQLIFATSELKGKSVYLIDNNPWYYPLADVKDPSKYVVYYHLGQNRENIKDFSDQISKKAEYIIENRDIIKDVPIDLQNMLRDKYLYMYSVGKFDVYSKL